MVSILNKKTYKLFFLIIFSVLVILIGISVYLTSNNGNKIKDTESVKNDKAVVNLTKDDTAYQSIYPEYEIAYVYILNTFSNQLDTLENNDSIKENFYTVTTDFQELVSDFIKKVPDSPSTFQESRDFALSSALKTQKALKEYEQLAKEGNLTFLEDKKSLLNDAVSDFKKSQENYLDRMELLN